MINREINIPLLSFFKATCSTGKFTTETIKIKNFQLKIVAEITANIIKFLTKPLA